MVVVTSNHKIIFFLFNVVYFGIGVVMVGYGAGSLANILNFGFFTNDTFIGGSAIFIAVGILKLIFSVIGMIQVGFTRKWIFAIYAIALISLMMLTYVAAIYGFLVRPGAFNFINDQLKASVLNNASASAMMDRQNVERQFGCCGFDGVSPGCTVSVPVGVIYGEGCLPYLSNNVLSYLYNIGAIGMGFATFELASYLVAMQNYDEY